MVLWYLELVDNEGTVETARLSSEGSESEDRRIDLVIKVTALQETKWFGKAVYRVGKSIVLTAGQETPQGCQPRHGGEGIAIVLTGHAIKFCMEGGRRTVEIVGFPDHQSYSWRRQQENQPYTHLFMLCTDLCRKQS